MGPEKPSMSKIALLPFFKGSSLPDFLQFEKVFLYSLQLKLSLFSALFCKDYSHNASLLTWNPLQFPGQSLERLKELGPELQVQHILTGALTPHFNVHQSIESVQAYLLLFDVQLNQISFNQSLGLENVVSLDNTSSGFSPTMAAFESFINTCCEHLLKALLPTPLWAEQRVLLEAFSLGCFYENLIRMTEVESEKNAAQKIRKLEEILQKDPDFEPAYAQQGKLFRNMQLYEKSIEAYQNAFGRNKVPNGHNMIKAQYATEIGIGYALLGKRDLAIEWWKKSIESATGYLNPYLNIGHTYEEKESYPEAALYLEKAQHVAPEDFRTYASLARVYSKQHAWLKAIHQYQYLLQKDAEDPWFHSDIATCYLQLGETHNAREHFQKTIQLNPRGESAEFAKLVLEQLSIA